MPSRLISAWGVAVTAAGLSWFLPGCGGTTSGAPLLPADGGSSSGGSIPDPTKCVPLSSCETSTCPPSTDGGFSCSWACGQKSLCGTVEFMASGDAGATSVDETNARCLLTALRDGTAGQVMWGSTVASTTYEESIDIIAQRQTYGWWQYEEASYDYERFYGRSLQSAAYFQACLDANSIPKYLACLHGAYTDCQ